MTFKSPLRLGPSLNLRMRNMLQVDPQNSLERVLCTPLVVVRFARLLLLLPLLPALALWPQGPRRLETDPALDCGVRAIERGLWFISLAHTEKDIREALVTSAPAFARHASEWKAA